MNSVPANSPLAPAPPALALIRPEAGAVPLRGAWLAVARGAWVMLAGLAVVYFVLGLPADFARFQQVCADGSCTLSPALAQELQAAGLSVQFFPGYFLA